MSQQRFRIGVDIGGTFTDIVLLDTKTGVLFNEKVLTTPDDPSEGVLTGVSSVLAKNEVSACDVFNVIHGTTLVANALIERKGVKTALVTTKGFRDVLEIGREWRYNTYDLFIEMPEPLVPRELRFELEERVGPDGKVITPLDQDAARDLARRLASSDVEAVGVLFLHSFKNDQHEKTLKALFAENAPGLTVCISSEVMPEIGEYERSSTTIANAYVQPIFRTYIERLAEGLRSREIKQDLFMMLSDGGTIHKDAAIEFPIRQIQSGPAGGAQAASVYGRLAGLDKVLCFDMGGTTAKACLIENGEPSRTTDFEVARVYRFAKGSGLPLKVPVIDMIEIGAGGGSIAQIDRLGLIRIGPESSGAQPGPACYGLGGRRATVTDSDLVLGYLDPDAFLGGDMKLHPDLAREALKRDVADPLGISIIEAAWGIHETVNENMAQAASIHALESGRKISNFAMTPIGGAGPVHACNLAKKMGIAKVVCPLGAGVASAFGFLASPISFEFVQANVSTLDELVFGQVRNLLSEMEMRGSRLLDKAGVERTAVTNSLSAAMRYSGQGYEIELPLLRDLLEREAASQFRALFEKKYLALFGRLENLPLEVISWLIVVAGPRPELDIQGGATVGGGGAEAIGKRPVFFSEAGGFVETPVFDRSRLAPGSHVEGPAILQERESTIVLPPDCSAVAEGNGNLIVALR